MTTRPTHLVTPLLLLLVGCGGSTAAAPPPTPVEIISNLQGAENADSSLVASQGRSAAVGFRMPNQNHELHSLKLKLRSFTSATIADCAVELHADGTAGKPAGLLATFVNPTTVPDTGMPEVLTFTPPAPVLLAANATYWVVVFARTIDGPGWTCGNPSTTPTGLATSVGALFDLFTAPNPPTTASDSIGEYAVYGIPR